MSAGGWAGYLDPDEELIWEGAPEVRTILIRKWDALLIPFSLVWGGFAVLWNVSVWSEVAPHLLFLWGLPFLILGLCIMIGRFFHDATRRRSTRHALTDKRAFIARHFFSRSLQEKKITPSLPLALVPGRRGPVTLGEVVSALLHGAAGRGAWSGESPDFAFEFIDDPESVYQLVRGIQRKDR